MTSKRRQSNLSLVCYLYITIHHLHNIQLASSRLSQSHSSHSLPRSLPNRDNCLEAPCIYKNECRDQNRICGESATHCNEQSVWMPACGGGAGLDKPTAAATTVVALPPTPPPTNRPTLAPSLNPTTAWDLWTGNKNQPTTTSNDSNDIGTFANPTTAWDLWTGNKNQPTTTSNDSNDSNDENAKEGQNNQNTKAKEGDGYTFDADRWGYYGEKEDKGILDQMKDFATLNKAIAREKIHGMILLTATAVLAW
eukprot:CAMPEP_0196158884 /NCGR_PEP_ID=MMETSP0910-20130528/46038_1 /TAXON_ID=49265 /ORGANISM="Thalassiosira rotula, Strain GSO102" /LENGTH=251 /DNA_ID=CAMNT_0041423795 /DNA_START=140 /DNA_END=893 /DNA_ORIENTATION=-